MPSLPAALRILSNTVGYRIRNHEMANLASSLSIMLAMRLPWEDVAIRFAFAFALNAAVYLVNDIFDVAADRVSNSKEARKTAFLQAHPRQAWQAVALTVVITATIGIAWNRELLFVLLVVGVTSVAYSALIKRIAFLDLPTIFLCVVSGSMLAFPLERTVGLCLAILLGCFAVCFQTVQMVRDHDEDASFGIRTTAVALGTRSMVWLQRALLAVAATYATLLVHRWVGAAMFLTVALPFDATRATVHWSRIRIALGLAWLAIIGSLWWQRSLFGLLFELPLSATMK